MAVTLTRAQTEALDDITVVRTREEVEQMSFMEAQIYRELLAHRDAMEAEMLAGLEAPVTLTPEPEPVLELPEPEPDPTPEPEEIPEPVALVTPSAPKPPELDVPERTFSKSERDNWEKRYKDLQSSVSPLQQKAATQRKALNAAESRLSEAEQWKADIDAKFAKLESLLEGRKAPEPMLDLTDEFIPYPEVARRIAQIEARAKQDLEARLSEMKQQQEAERIALQQNQFQNYTADHNAFVAQHHPDWFQTIQDPAKRGAVEDWMKTIPAYERQVLENPYNYSPIDVVEVIDKFKRAKNPSPNAAKKPSLGDLAAAKPRTAIHVTSPEAEAKQYLTNEQMKDDVFTRLLQQATDSENPKAVETLLTRYENTLRKQAAAS